MNRMPPPPSFSVLANTGSSNGWKRGYCTRHLCKDIIIISSQLEAIKTGSGGRPGNEAESVRMLALFQDQVTLITLMVRLKPVSCLDPLTREPARRLDCNIACHKCH